MSFFDIQSDTLEYEATQGICVPHGFTTRLGGVSEGIFASLNIACHRGDSEENVAENFRRLGKAIGFDPARVVLTRQTHSDIVRVVTAADCQGLDHHQYPECDALITCDPGTALLIFTADCTPILLHDPVTGAVGAVHAGWRGTAADIAGKTVEAMQDNFGCDPANLCAAIGPNIGPCCFETDRDVPDGMLAALGDGALPFIQTRGEKFHVDLKGLNALWLRRSGVTNIEISNHCTACAPDLFWSHRVTSGKRGSQGAVILCEGGK